MSTVMDYKNQDVIPQSSCGGLPYQREALDTERSERIKAVAKNKGLSISHVLKLNKDFAIKEIE